MKYNLGNKERVIRAVVGSALLGYGIYAENWLASIGVWLVMTVFSKWCPVYSVFGFSTAPKEDTPREEPTS